MAWIIANRPLSQTEMENNAIMVRDYFIAQGWTLNAIAAMLGNMQTESTINPGAWEGYATPGNMSKGYGIVQWTPASKYIDWAGAGYENGDLQCYRIIWELMNGEQWYPTTEYNFSFYTFSISTLDVIYLADAFLKNYERPSDQNQPQRGTQAQYWYTYLGGIPPIPTKRTGMPLWMMCRRKY